MGSTFRSKRERKEVVLLIDMRLILGVVFSLLCATCLMAQETAVESTSPTSIKWHQINTAHFRILFPENFNEQAQRMANTMEHIREPEGKSLGITPRKIPIVLHNQSAVSNGFVTQAPWRSEFFSMPSQNYNFTGVTDWLTFLASHEYRHMVQFQKSRTGVGKIAYYLLGELAQFGLASITIPDWFWEGDAVATETAFTRGGRGRIPQFNALLRTNLLEGKSFNYHKQYLRSYKDNIPNHYVLGYHMVAFLRKKTGDPNIWANITKRAWGLPLPFSFSNAIKKETGMYVKDLYREMMLDLKEQWLKQQEEITITSFETINHRKSKIYTDYAYPQPLQDGSILALKSGLGNIATLVTITPDGKEHKKFVPGPLNATGMLSAENNKVVWNEYRYDPRWEARSYSVIKAYDLTSKKTKVLGKKTRYASAAISPDGTKAATVETTPTYQTRLVIVDYLTGKAIKNVDNPNNDFISMPRWSHNGQYIVFIALSKAGKSIRRYRVKEETIETVLVTHDENVGYPIQYGNYLLYNSPIDGIDNIYALDLTTKKQLQVTSSKYGAYNPAISPDGKTVYYNEQTVNGLDIVKAPFDPTTWVPLDNVKKDDPGMYGNLLAEQENHPHLMDSIPSKKYPVNRYRRVRGMIHPHTWGAYTNSSFNSISLGILSKDILSTTVIDIGYRYDINEEEGGFHAGFSYQGLYPIFDLDINYRERSAKQTYIYEGVPNTVQFNWNELNVEAGVRVPLITTRSKYTSKITIGNAVGLTKVNSFTNNEGTTGRIIPVSRTNGILFRSYVDNGDLIYNHLNVQAYQLLKQSRRDIYSRWGQSLNLNLFSSFTESDYMGNQFSAVLILYFPGLFPHHSLWGYTAYQYAQIEQKIDNYLFSNQAPTPRGHQVSVFQDYYMASANYTFPILYPDLALGPILNIQRVWGTAFFDYAMGETTSLNTTGRYTSVGGELRFDINVMRFLKKINLGIRYSYAIETNSPEVRFVLGRIGF